MELFKNIIPLKGQIVEKELPILKMVNKFKVNSGEPFHKEMRFFK